MCVCLSLSIHIYIYIYIYIHYLGASRAPPSVGWSPGSDLVLAGGGPKEVLLLLLLHVHMHDIYIYIYIYIKGSCLKRQLNINCLLRLKFVCYGRFPKFHRVFSGRDPGAFTCWLHPVSITRFPLRRFSPGAGLLRNPFVHR